MYWFIAYLCPRYSCVLLNYKTSIFSKKIWKVIWHHCSIKFDWMHFTTHLKNKNILRSTSRLEQFMQQIVLPSLFVVKKKDYFKNFGQKSPFLWDPVQPHCFGFASWQNGHVGWFSGENWPCSSLLSYVLIAATTPGLMGAVPGFPQAFTHCSCVSKRFWFPPQPPYQKRVQLLLGAS